MTHRCVLDGATACRAVEDSSGRAVWTHRLDSGEQQQYLFNGHFRCGDGTDGVY
jgi:hypothetical protein